MLSCSEYGFAFGAGLHHQRIPEFAATAVAEWTEAHGVELAFIQPGRPMQNGFIERFNGSYRRRGSVRGFRSRAHAVPGIGHDRAMGERLAVHPRDPQPRALLRAVEAVRAGQLLLVPTDAGYSLSWGLDARQAEERVIQLRMLDIRHPFTVLCASLSAAGKLTRVDDRAFRLLRSLAPGPVTFILPAAPELPKRLKLARRRALGVRIPGHRVARRLLEELGEPLLATSVELPEHESLESHDAEAVAAALQRHVDVILDAGECPPGPTSVIDCCGDEPVVTRQGNRPVTL